MTFSSTVCRHLTLFFLDLDPDLRTMKNNFTCPPLFFKTCLLCSAGLVERWDIICRCVEGRARSLRQVLQLWTEADTERDRLANWLAGVERMLRNGPLD